MLIEHGANSRTTYEYREINDKIANISLGTYPYAYIIGVSRDYGTKHLILFKFNVHNFNFPVHTYLPQVTKILRTQ